MKSGWVRASRTKPCQICGRPNAEHTSRWCIFQPGEVAICGFTPEGGRDLGEAGYLHRLDGGRSALRDDRPRTKRAAPTRIRVVDWVTLQDVYARGVRKLSELATPLGVTVDSLVALGIGWDGKVWTFPMFNFLREIVGIRRRSTDGRRKDSVLGSRNGVFIPRDWNGGDPVYVCEGPTDTAYVHGLGLPVLGRPACRGAEADICALVMDSRVVILSDVDSRGAGRRGSEALRDRLGRNRTIIVEPPAGHKDVRDWRPSWAELMACCGRGEKAPGHSGRDARVAVKRVSE